VKEPDLRKILSRLGVEVVQRTHSGWLHASCPFAKWTHRSGRDANPSFGAKVDEGGISSYHCHSCKMHGRVSSLARALGHHRHGNLQHYAALAMEADDYDRGGLSTNWIDEVEEREVPPEPIVEEIYENMFTPAIEHPDAMQYLDSRNIGPATITSLGLLFDSRQRRVVFPVRGFDGECYGYTGRAISDETQPKVRDYAGLKKRWHILGQERWHENAPKRPLIIVEGLFGYAHLVNLNVEVVADVGALLGSELSEHKADVIKRRNARTFLLVDNDPAGDQCLFGRTSPDGTSDYHDGAVARLENRVPLAVPEWPEGKDDPDQLTKREVWEILKNTPTWGQGETAPRWV